MNVVRVSRSRNLASASELEESFVRAPGPGGQNVNKVASAVQLRFDVAAVALAARRRARAPHASGRAAPDQRGRADDRGASLPDTRSQSRRRARAPVRPDPPSQRGAEAAQSDQADGGFARAAAAGEAHARRSSAARRSVAATDRIVQAAGWRRILEPRRTTEDTEESEANVQASRTGVAARRALGESSVALVKLVIPPCPACPAWFNGPPWFTMLWLTQSRNGGDAREQFEELLPLGPRQPLHDALLVGQHAPLERAQQRAAFGREPQSVHAPVLPTKRGAPPAARLELVHARARCWSGRAGPQPPAPTA